MKAITEELRKKIHALFLAETRERIRMGFDLCYCIGMEENRLSWDEIKKLYYQQWVELVDYDWPDGEPYPHSGVLRSHGADRKEFYLQCKREPVPLDSAIVFVGPPPIPKGVVLSPSLIRIEPCEKSD